VPSCAAPSSDCGTKTCWTITAALSADQDGRRRFQLRTSPDEIIDPLAKDILVKLQALHRLSAELTPMQLIAFAIREAQPPRGHGGSPRSTQTLAPLANLDAIVELARPYNVAGLRAFCPSIFREGGSASRRHSEGRVDASEDSVEDRHHAQCKGSRMACGHQRSTRQPDSSPQDQFVYRQSDDTIHWIIGGIEPPALAAAREEEEFREARQRERLYWYVANHAGLEIC